MIMAESKNSGMVATLHVSKASAVKMYVIVALNYKRSKMGNQQPNSKSKVFKELILLI
jgi:hypothetical protein